MIRRGFKIRLYSGVIPSLNIQCIKCLALDDLKHKELTSMQPY
jgi:hypothetical protein